MSTWHEWIAGRPPVLPWPRVRYWLRGVVSLLWIAAASYELLTLFFGTNREALLTPFVLHLLTSYGALAFLAGAAVARAFIPYHAWEPWPPPPWWGIAIVAGTAAGLALIDLVPGPAEAPFVASGAFGTIVGHLFWSKCADEEGNLTDCEDRPSPVGGGEGGSPLLRP